MREIPRYDRNMDHESLQRWAADAQTAIDEAQAEIEFVKKSEHAMQMHAIDLAEKLMRVRGALQESEKI